MELNEVTTKESDRTDHTHVKKAIEILSNTSHIPNIANEERGGVILVESKRLRSSTLKKPIEAKIID